MKTEKTENPQAFPQEWTINGTTDNWENGMTLRDYFAAKAMEAMISNPSITRPGENEKGFIEFSKRSYRYADAMLKQREL